MQSSGPKVKINRWVIIVILGMASGMSFELAYLRYNYHEPMRVLMGFSDTQLGFMMSLYGILAMCLYAPSGILADKFSCRKLVVGNLVLTGLGGFVMATYPPYWLALALQVFWAFTTIMLGWSSSIKIISLLGSSEEQGKIMGFQEGMRGLGCMWTAFLTMFIFARLGAENNAASLRSVMIAYGIIFVAMGILCWFIVPDTKPEPKKEGEKKEKGVLLLVLRKKETYLISGVIFGVYMMFTILSYTASYLVNVFGMSMVMAGTIGIVRNQVFRTLAPPAGAFIASKTALRSPTKLSLVCGIISALGLIIFLIVPTRASLLVPLIILVLFLAFLNYVAKGMNWGCAGETKIDKRILGTTIGVCSVLGYLPDAFVYPIIGNWQDTLPAEQAYRNMWILGLAGTLVLVISGFWLLKVINKNNKEAKLVAEK